MLSFTSEFYWHERVQIGAQHFYSFFLTWAWRFSSYIQNNTSRCVWWLMHLNWLLKYRMSLFCWDSRRMTYVRVVHRQDSVSHDVQNWAPLNADVRYGQGRECYHAMYDEDNVYMSRVLECEKSILTEYSMGTASRQNDPRERSLTNLARILDSMTSAVAS